ncbi:hypothetical protein ACFPER_03410 [Agromyces aurantiacus]|uniref:Uncharacterized protein n=1 Tax=Agromyces aurantiacus TaxID=165814 RepID=A0ABV9R3K7_9MICO|nr:hypothetical protein [Agromyces aurantiacus]
MPRRVELPSHLAARAFSTAEARREGVGDGRLRGRDLARPFHGVRSAYAPSDVLDRCRTYLPRLRSGQFFSHDTAALLWGIPLPGDLDSDAPLHVSSFAPNRPPRTRGVVGHELRTGTARVIDRRGLPVADAVSTWVQLAGHAFAACTVLRQSSRIASSPSLGSRGRTVPHRRREGPR